MFTDEDIITFYNDPMKYIEYLTNISENDAMLLNELESNLHSNVRDSNYFDVYVSPKDSTRWKQEINVLSVQKFIDLHDKIVHDDIYVNSIMMLSSIETFVNKLVDIHIRYDECHKMMIELIDLWFLHSQTFNYNVKPLHVGVCAVFRYPDVVARMIKYYNFSFYYMNHHSIMLYLQRNPNDELLTIHQKKVNRYKITDGTNRKINEAISF